MIRGVVLAVVLLLAAALAAAQQSEPGIGDQIRGFFERIFGGGADKKAEQPKAEQPKAELPKAETPKPPVVEERPPPPAAQPVVATPSARPESQGLHEALAKGDYSNALKMIQQGADIEAKDPGAGASALHYAVMGGKMPIIELLIARRADVNSRTRNGTTPLHTAVLYGRADAARLLIDNGAEINAQSASGATPLALAEAAKNKPVIDLLRGHGAR